MDNLTIKNNKRDIKKSNKFIKLKPYMYILPLGILLFSFYVLPIIMSIFFSFTKYNIMKPPIFIGLENYKNLLNDKTLIISIKNTMKFAIIVVPIQTFMALILSVWITNKGKSKIASFAKGALFIPVLSSMVLIGMVWKALLSGDESPVSIIFGSVGIDATNLLGNSKTALYTLMAIAVWKNVGYFIVIYISAIMNIPRDCYEASSIDGASRFQQFIKITMPLLRTTTIMVVFLGIVWSLQIFDLVYTLTGGGPGMSTMTIVMHAYNLNFKNFNSGYAMSVANVLFLIIAIASILQNKLLKKDNSSI